MTSTTPRIITIALAVLALAAPVASAMPLRDNGDVRTSSLAGTTGAPKQDLRNADNRAPSAVAPQQDLRNADNRAPRDVTPDRPAPAPAKPRPVVADDGTSPLVYIVPSLLLVAMLAAGVAYARTPRRSPA
jgi:hypothetical protein